MSDIPFSKKYLHELKKLYIEHQEGSITDEEFSHSVDELKEKEVQSNEPLGRILLVQKLGEVEKEIESEVKGELQRKIQALEAEDWVKRGEDARQLKKQQQEQREREYERDSYRNNTNYYIKHLENNAQKWQLRYTWLQIILLVFSASTATMASIDGVPRPIVSVAGLVATIAGGLLTTFKIQDRIYANRKAVAEVKLECQKYDYHLEEYNKTYTEEEVFIKFSKNINAIKGQEMLQEVELWNPKKDSKPDHSEEAQKSLSSKIKPNEMLEEQKLITKPQDKEQNKENKEQPRIDEVQ